MLGLGVLLLTGLLLAVALTTALLVHRLRHPPRKTYAWAVAKSRPGTPAELDVPRPFEETVLEVGGRGLPAWVIQGDDPRGLVVIFTPGWGDSRLGVLPRLAPLLAHADRVIAWDPPGLGEASGVCSLGVDEPRLLLGLVQRCAPGKPVVLAGASLGAGVSIVAAAAAQATRQSDLLRIIGVIAEAPYRLPWTPARNVMRLSAMPWMLPGPLGFFCMGLARGDPFWRNFDRAGSASKLTLPLLVLHGQNDEVCPLADGRAIADAASCGVLEVIPGGKHNNLWTDEANRPRTAQAVGRFMQSLRPGAPL